MTMRRREFLAAGVALNFASAAIALADQTGTAPARGGGGRGPVPKRIAKTTKMFKSPGMYPNALAVMTDAPGGLWIGQQKANPSNAKQYGVPEEAMHGRAEMMYPDYRKQMKQTASSLDRCKRRCAD